MHTKRSWARLLAGVAILSLSVAACGDDKESDDKASDTTEASDTTSATDSTEETTTTAKPVDCPTAGESDGVLKLGALLPETGSLAQLGPPEIAGAKLAVQEINAAGGVLGKPVEWLKGDSGDTSTDIANQTVDKHLAAEVDAIVGAASSGVTSTVIDKIVGAGKVQFSPANTAKTLSTREDCDLYFRTAPSDVLQAQVLSDTVQEDGYDEVAVLALQDPYGEGLAEDFVKNFEASGGKVVYQKIYDPNAANYDPEVQAVVDSNPKALVLIAFAEGTKIIKSLTEKGKGPKDLPIYMTDGYTDNGSGKGLPAGTLDGITGSVPEKDPKTDPEAAKAFSDKLAKIDPELGGSTAYGPETYDAVTIISLAAEAAKSDDGLKIGAEIPGITKDGDKCTDFTSCKALLDQGKNIDYDGASGPTDMDDEGDPIEGSYAIKQFGPDNTLKVLKYVTVSA